MSNYAIKVNRVVDGGEPALFKQYFSSWKETSLVPQHALVTKNNRVSGICSLTIHWSFGMKECSVVLIRIRYRLAAQRQAA